MKKYYLIPQYSTQASFNNKATIEISEDNTILNLYSYNTFVASVDKLTNKAEVFNTQSQTTVKHVKEFLLQNGFKAENKAQIEKDYKF